MSRQTAEDREQKKINAAIALLEKQEEDRRKREQKKLLKQETPNQVNAGQTKPLNGRPEPKTKIMFQVTYANDRDRLKPNTKSEETTYQDYVSAPLKEKQAAFNKLKLEAQVREDEREWQQGYKKQKTPETPDPSEEQKEKERKILERTKQLQLEFEERSKRVLAQVAAEDALEKRDAQGRMERASEHLFPAAPLIAAHREPCMNLTRLMLLRAMEQAREDQLSLK